MSGNSLASLTLTPVEVTVSRRKLTPLSIIACLFFALSSPLLAQTAQNSRPLTANADENWIIRWNRSDDFNGDQVDWRKWNKNPETFGAWTWDNESNVSVSDGYLTITMRRRPPSGKSSPTGGRRSTPYTSGMLKSYATGTYGYYEARIKGAPLFPGVCPAFWLYSRTAGTRVRGNPPRRSARQDRERPTERQREDLTSATS